MSVGRPSSTTDQVSEEDDDVVELPFTPASTASKRSRIWAYFTPVTGQE